VSLAWLAPLLVLGLVVFVHELGHFLAAKMCGVYAPRFSLGWGSPLWRWRPKGSETEYVISWLPIGGYVRMASRDDETMSKIEGGGEKPAEPTEAHDKYWDPEAMIPHGPKPIPESRWFESKNTAQRVFILLAGVTMNVILTYVIAVGVIARYGLQVPVENAVVSAVVDTILPGRPAEAAGFAKGDSVIAVDGKAIGEWTDFQRELSNRPGQTIGVTVTRAGETKTLTVTTEPVELTDSTTGEKRTVGRIGIGPRQIATTRRDVSVGEASVLGFAATRNMAVKVVDVVQGLFRGSVGVDQLGGPIAIARASVQTARSGMEDLFTLIAFLSVNLAVLNLLPVPILDGGQIIVTVAEGLRGKAFTIKTRENLMKAGVAFILVLFSIVMFNDLKSLVKSWFS
jgi:regulator of sigma E protease